MNVGIMLRHLDQHGGGVRVYTEQLLDRLFAIGGGHRFTLLYPSPRFLGSYSHHPNVREVSMRMPAKFLWDQLAAPWLARRENVDVVFNPKYSLPLLSGRTAVFVCHGLDWYVMPSGSKWPDRLNHRLLIPLFVNKSSGIIAVSNAARRHFLEHFNYDPDRVVAVYLGVNEVFRRPVDATARELARKKYGLPERYVLYVGQIYPAKNFRRLLEAYALVGPERGVSLVIAGDDSSFKGNELAHIDELGISEWVVQPGWIEQDELPPVYHLAEALLMPSLYEGCPSPLLEAMCCGCPVVTANRYGMEDLAGNAAVLVNPEDIDDIARGLSSVLTDESIRTRCIEWGYERARGFSYDRCAAETLRALEALHQRANARPASV